MNNLQQLVHIGAVQFGQFEIKGHAGSFQPLKIDVRLLASYPEVLRALAAEFAPLVRINGLTHLLAMPSMVVIGVAVSLHTGLPLVYPAGDDLEGAFDYNVPTVLLTDVLADDAPTLEKTQRMIVHARKQGLDVEAIASVFDFRAPHSGAFSIPVRSAYRLDAVLRLSPSPSMQNAVQAWLTQPHIT